MTRFKKAAQAYKHTAERASLAAGAGPGPPQPPLDAQDAMYHFQGNQNTRPRDRPREGRRRDFDFRAPREKLFQRPLLTTKHEGSEELTFSTNHGQDRFREVEDLSDTEEEQMDISESDDDTQPSKRRRFAANDSTTDAAPRWSNPDPYTSLPPIDDSGRKHKDVVKLIRKSRIEGATGRGVPATNGEDFISFDLDDDNPGQVQFSVGLRNQAPSDAPTGPKAATMTVPDTLNRSKAANKPVQNAPTGPKAATGTKPNSSMVNGRTTLNAPDTHSTLSLGKRKRDDSAQHPARLTPREQLYNTDGMITTQWQPTGNVDPTPWLRNVEHTGLEYPGITLHKEIVDFYEWVRPRDFEHAVRADLISRLQKAFERLEPGGKLQAFGSFAAGLYLPTGDMDLVYLRSAFKGRSINNLGQLIKPPQAVVRAFATFIANKGIAKPGTVKPIFQAKVPIIKFVEKISGLKVDLSFDNDTGIVANQTFHKWKAQHPAMPILVSIIKHFLMMRGLNDVAYGGLGGFSIICLVTSLIQHFPRTSQPPNLGVLLLEFFNVYGNLFNRNDVAIRLDPPGYIQKRGYAYLVHNKERPDCLSIIDPHRPDNNISAGTHEIQRVLSCFRKAHEVLQRRLAEGTDLSIKSGSLLEDILGGNFSAYEIQRESLNQVHQSMIVPPPPRFAEAEIPPPPPPPNAILNSKSTVPSQAAALAANQGASASNRESTSLSEKPVGTKLRKGMNRALRFQELRPDVLDAKRVKSLSVDEAIRLGGYQNSEEMNSDLEQRAKAVGKSLSLITI